MNGRALLGVLAMGWGVVAAVAGVDEGLVARYTFEQDGGRSVVDSSGQGNNGTIQGGASRLEGTYGGALALDGKDAYVDCGRAASLNIARAGTVMLWVCPRALEGGLVNWSTGGGWSDERLVLAFNTYGGGNHLITALADGRGYVSREWPGVLAAGQWYHLAFSFDGREVRLYRDGLPAGACGQGLTPAIADVPLWLGRCQGLGKEYLPGLIDEVRIYNRGVTEEEVTTIYRQEAAGRGKDMSPFTQPALAVGVYPTSGQLMLDCDARGLRPLPAGATLRVTVTARGGRKALIKAVFPVTGDGRPQVPIDAAPLLPGEYRIAAQVLNAKGRPVGNESFTATVWPGQDPAFRSIRVLNNLCWELLGVREKKGVDGARRYSFDLPLARWVWVRTTTDGKTGSAQVALDTPATVLQAHDPGAGVTRESMRFLAPGRHSLLVNAEGGLRFGDITVRAVPVLQHAFYAADPHIAPYGPYDWEFLKKDVLPNVNMMLSSGAPPDPARLRDWTASGRQWATIVNIPPDVTMDSAGIDKVYEYWATTPGMRQPGMSGIIVDEFGGGDAPVYDIYRAAVGRLYANPEFAGRIYMPYGGTFYRDDRSRKFAKMAMSGGGYLCWERYLPEPPSETAARAVIRNQVTAEMPLWEQGIPGCTRQMIMVYGYMSQPTESLNIDPAVDYRVFMDMQIRALATHPAFFGLGGIQEYHSSYCDEENVRLAGRLYRHYCIEGRTDPYLADPYRLTHIANPDFEDGIEGWTVRAAEPGAVAPQQFSGYGWLEGRYPRTAKGDTALRTRRSATAPNVFSQTVRGLTPGRLYSLKMITGDYQDLVQEKSTKATHAVSLRLDNVDILPGPKHSFQFVFPNCYAHVLGKFNAKYPYWMNYHWRVFRAQGTTAELSVSDWAAADRPGGPAGQELLYNFIEIEPYLGE